MSRMQDVRIRSLGRDVAVVVVTALACVAAVRWPSYAYLLLLTAVTASIWYAGRTRAVVLTLGTIFVAAILATIGAGFSLSG
ncbi:MAG TPA: hypothetical protein VH277_00550, partial [Gemmatimonadaceae bacterium]|nr:hypothetical protein [Gemmatimonadaceae bacterium]